MEGTSGSQCLSKQSGVNKGTQLSELGSMVGFDPQPTSSPVTKRGPSEQDNLSSYMPNCDSLFVVAGDTNVDADGPAAEKTVGPLRH